MKKRINILFLIFVGLISFSLFNVSAKSISYQANHNQKMVTINDYFLIADNTDKDKDKTDKSDNNNDVQYNQELECEGLLGDPVNDPDSVAWFLVKILNYLKLLGPLMVLVLSSLDFAKAILMSDDESLKKAQSNLITRLILAALLFVLPTLIEVLLDIFGITSSDICIFDWQGGIK
ncbi:MAG: hypothetical protein ACI4WP_01490 [Bacilli bacterium]